jgi:NAD(P) transhydrogenase subunit alpha
MRISVPRESTAGESRVALTPEAVAKLAAGGAEVAVERGAGVAAGFTDDDYAAAGATLGGRAETLAGAAIVVCVRRPDDEALAALSPGTALLGFLAPLTDREGIERLDAHGVIGFAMESLPRITRAQSMDALSSQATVAGYKAVLIAADRVPKLFPMMMTAAGTIAPARVLVLGAGVAGLQAIATARRLGAVVSAFDVRPAVAEQVQSLGATFLDLGVKGEETEGGYAKELAPEQQAAQQRALEERIPDFDVVITTALVPGRPAPRLIPAAAVERMRPGSCVVDLAAETGGNCELTVPGEETVVGGVTIVGHTNLPSTMAADASRLYARNVLALLELLAPQGELALDWEDEIVAGACVTQRPEAPSPEAATEPTEEEGAP